VLGLSSRKILKNNRKKKKLRQSYRLYLKEILAHQLMRNKMITLKIVPKTLQLKTNLQPQRMGNFKSLKICPTTWILRLARRMCKNNFKTCKT